MVNHNELEPNQEINPSDAGETAESENEDGNLKLSKTYIAPW